MNTHSNKNGIYLLLGLIIFASAFVLFINSSASKNKEIKKVEVASVINNTSSSVEVAQVTSNDKEPKVIPATSYVDLDVIDHADNSGQVLGCNESDLGCVVNNSIKYQPLCTKSSADVVVGDGNEVGRNAKGVEVTKNSVIEVWKVTAPLGFLSGSQYVKDSRMAITNVDDGYQGVFKPAYDIILDDEARAFCTPGVNCEEFDDLIANGPKEAYFVNVHAEMSSETPTNHPDPDHAVIKPELNSACPKVQESKPNPIKTNRKGTFIESNFQIPGDHAHARSNSGVPCLNANSGQIEEANGFISCLEKRTPYNFLVAATVAIKDWFECTVGHKDEETGEWHKPDPNDCKTSVVTALKIDALFGSIYKCTNNNCASRYMDLTQIANSIPGSNTLPEGFESTLNNPVVDDPVYVSTPCKIRVNGTKIYDIPCLWDLSVLKRDYQRQKQAAVPGDPNIPATFDEYWKMVELQANSRKDACNN